MSEDPLVTVVMPTWNRLPFVEEAVRSVIAQTYRHWELIVVDDGSTDGTADRLQALGERRLKVISRPHAGHLGELRNRGAAAGSGELIAFLDSDDVWFPQKLEVQINALRESGAGWCYSRFEVMDADCRTIPIPVDKFCLLSGDIMRELLILKPTVRTSTFVVRRNVFDAAGGYSEDPRLPTGGDYELYLRLGPRARAVAVPDALARYREHSNRTSSLRRTGPHELTALIYEVFLACGPDASHARLARRLRARSLADAGAQFLSAGKLGRAALLFGRSAQHGAELKDWARALARGVRDGALRRRDGSKRA